jgi:hypothetical protein
LVGRKEVGDRRDAEGTGRRRMGKDHGDSWTYVVGEDHDRTSALMSASYVYQGQEKESVHSPE